LQDVAERTSAGTCARDTPLWRPKRRRLNPGAKGDRVLVQCVHSGSECQRVLVQLVKALD
jgi:hypothetical protein